LFFCDLILNTNIKEPIWFTLFLYFDDELQFEAKSIWWLLFFLPVTVSLGIQFVIKSHSHIITKPSKSLPLFHIDVFGGKMGIIGDIENEFI
jgi:hypothetical protein